jgi:hypothetical protein
MEVTLEIPFEQLVKIVKELAPDQKAELKKELVEKEETNPGKRNSLTELLLNGPVFTKKQIQTIKETRKSINEWRTKS